MSRLVVETGGAIWLLRTWRCSKAASPIKLNALNINALNAAFSIGAGHVSDIATAVGMSQTQLQV